MRPAHGIAPFDTVLLHPSLLLLPVPRRAPSVAVVAGSPTHTSAVVAVTPPAGTTAATFDKFVLYVCSGAPGATSSCLVHECAAANAAACAISGLTPGQAYQVYVEATKGAAKSLRGGPAAFNARYR